MFKFLRKPLARYDGATIAAVFCAAAVRDFNVFLSNEASSIGSPGLFKQMDHDAIMNMQEVYLSFFFGRVFARLEVSNPRSPFGPVPRSIPEAPKLIADSPDFYYALETNLLWYNDDIGSPLRMDSLMWKAFSVSSAYLSGTERFFQDNFSKAVSARLKEVGYSQKSVDKVLERYIRDVDLVIDSVCRSAEDRWRSEPSFERRRAIEEFARMAYAVISEINERNKYDVFLELREGDT